MSYDPAGSDDHPNVLVVLCDQLRGSALGCAGDPNVETPNIDRLAREGVRFTNACSSFPVCVPARFSLVTGEHAHSRFVPSIDYRLSPAERTVAHELGDAGYETCWVGKWHLAGLHRFNHNQEDTDTGRMCGRKPIPPSLRGGFEHWRGFELRNAPFDTYYFEDDDPEPRPVEGFQTDGLFDIAIQFLTAERDRDAPFFQVVSVEPPHAPFTAPREYLERWRERDLSLRPNVDLDRSYAPRGGDDLRRRELGMTDGLLDDYRAYYAMVENIDDNVGRLLDLLDRTGLREETAVIFLADHGEKLGCHGDIGKEDPYEESINVPFVVSLPGGCVESGQTIADPVCLEDVFPTVLGLAGLDPDPAKPGVDLSPVLRGDSDGLDREAVLLEHVVEHRPWMDFAAESWRGVRTAEYKYVVKGGPEGGRPWLLFDLKADPYEQENLIEDPEYETVAGELHGRLRERLLETGDTYTLRPAYGHDGLNTWTE